MVLGGRDFKNGYGWTFLPPKQNKKLSDAPKPTTFKQGLSLMCICWQCNAPMIPPTNTCDWITHDPGCNYVNVIAGGNAHSHNHRDFVNAMSTLSPSSKLKQIKLSLAAHEKAAKFWGFGDLDTVINTPGKWEEVKSAAFLLHGAMKNFALSMDTLAKKK